MPDADLVAQIMRDFPQYAFLLNDPDVGPLLLQAVDPNKGFDAQEFQAKLEQTPWWRTTQASQRQWQVLANTDPATASAQKEQWKFAVNQMASNMGVRLEGADLAYWADYFMPMGIQPGDPRLRAQLVQTYSQRGDLRYGQPGAETGSIAATRDQVKTMASQYMRKLSDADLTYWEYQIAGGTMGLDSLQTVLRNQAKDRFGYYASEIDQGATPEQLFADRRDAIAQQLEVDPSAIDLMNDPRWSKVLGVPDKDGKTRAMTYAESIALARSQSEFKNTSVGKQLGADLTTTLLKTFGKVGG